MHVVSCLLYLTVQVQKRVDQVGCTSLSEALCQVGGSLIPLGMLLCLSDTSTGQALGPDPCDRSPPRPIAGKDAFPFDSSFRYILSTEQAHRLAFPTLEGVLHWGEGEIISCAFFLPDLGL